MAPKNKRVPDWQRELLLWGERQRRMKWAWGETDCVTLMVQGLEVAGKESLMRTLAQEVLNRCFRKKTDPLAMLSGPAAKVIFLII